MNKKADMGSYKSPGTERVFIIAEAGVNHNGKTPAEVYREMLVFREAA